MSHVLSSRNATCKLQYTVKAGDLLTADELAMCRYTMHILHSEAVGGAGSCVQHGMLTCHFDPVSDRIVAAEFVFDVMGFMQQLQVR